MAKPPKTPPQKTPKAAAKPEAAPPKTKAAHPAPPKPPRERGGWLARFAPGVRSLVAKPSAKRETPENLWVKDPDTGEMIYRPDLEVALWVSPGGRHMRIRPKLRFAYTFDEGVYQNCRPPRCRKTRSASSTTAPMSSASSRPAPPPRSRTPWPWPSARSAAFRPWCWCRTSPSWAAPSAWPRRRLHLRRRNRGQEGPPARGLHRRRRRPDAGGALSLIADGAHDPGVQELKKARLPYIVVLTDPTTGGVTAPTPCWATYTWPRPGAMIGFAGPRVIEETIREVLPPGFQRSEYLWKRAWSTGSPRARPARGAGVHPADPHGRPPERGGVRPPRWLSTRSWLSDCAKSSGGRPGAPK